MALYVGKAVAGNGQIVVRNIGNNIHTIAVCSAVAAGNDVIVYRDALAAQICFNSDLSCSIVFDDNILIGFNDHKSLGNLKTLNGQSAVVQINLLTNAGIYIVDGRNLQRVKLCSGLSDKRDIFFVGYDKVLIAVIARLKEIRSISFERRRNSIRSYSHNIHIRILGILVVLIVLAILFIGCLCSNNGNTDSVDGFALILVAGFLFHAAGDENIIRYGIRLQASENTVSGRQIASPTRLVYTIFINTASSPFPINRLIQLCIALDAGDDDLVLQSKIAIIDNAKLRKLVSTAGLPKDSFVCGSSSSLSEIERFALGVCPGSGYAARIPCGCILQFNLQRTCLDFVHRCTCGVGEPREGRTNQHSYADEHSYNAGQQRALRCLCVIHCFFLLKIYFSLE